MNKIPKNEIFRKIIHILSSVVPLSYLWLVKDKDTMLLILVALSITALVVEFLRNQTNFFSKYFNILFDFMLREKESNGKWTGATWLLLGWTITVAMFEMPIAVSALLFLSIGDSFAALAGKIYPKGKIGDKTFSGTIVGLVFCLIAVTTINQTLLPVVILFGAIAAMGIELIPSKINDNLTIPVFSGLVMMIINKIA